MGKMGKKMSKTPLTHKQKGNASMASLIKQAQKSTKMGKTCK